MTQGGQDAGQTGRCSPSRGGPPPGPLPPCVPDLYETFVAEVSPQNRFIPLCKRGKHHQRAQVPAWTDRPAPTDPHPSLTAAPTCSISSFWRATA